MSPLQPAAATAGVVTFALLREPPAPPRQVSWQDRERALLATHEYPDGDEFDDPPERGVSTEPEVNWETTNYVQMIVSEADADWDGAALRALPSVCPTAAGGTGGNAFRVTVRRIPLPEPAGPDSVALHVDLDADNGVRVQEAIAVERVGGELVVLHAGTLADFDLDEFVRLTTAATAKAAATLG